MDAHLEHMMIKEVGLQCQMGIIAYDTLKQQLAGQYEFPVIFFLIHAQLTHAANVSKLFWPLGAAGERGKQRGIRLCLLLGIPDDMELKSRHLRDALDHFDEKLEKWAATSVRRNSVDMSVMPLSMIHGIDPGDYHRILDPTTMVFSFQEKAYNLEKVAEELRNVAARAYDWLIAHPWDSLSSPDP